MRIMSHEIIVFLDEGRRSNGDAWWWTEEVKEAASRKKEATGQCVKAVLRRIRGGMKA